MSWVGHMNKSQIVVSDIFMYISNPTPSVEYHIWIQKSWKLEFPLKLKCFGWMALHDKILTWENLSRRGFIGPSICFLCMQHSEDVARLLLRCPIATEVWNFVLHTLQIGGDLKNHSLESYLRHWFETQYEFCTLPFYIIWGIWCCRNPKIFEHKRVDVRNTVLGIAAYYSETGPKIDVQKLRKIIRQDVWKKLPVGFFGGACSNSQCGSVALIVI